MSNTLAMHVANGLNELFGVLLDDWHGQTALDNEVVKEISLGQKLCRNVTNICLLAPSMFQCG